MTFSLLVKDKAEEDISEIFAWYEKQQKGLGVSFLDELDQVFSQLKRYPKSFAVRYRKVRMAIIRRFPFGVHYKFERRKIVVLAVLHTSSNPENWKL